MKSRTIVALITLLLTTSSFAKNIATYRFSTKDADSRVHDKFNVFHVTLNDEQQMNIKVSTTVAGFPIRKDFSAPMDLEVTKELNDYVYKQLKRKIISLSNAKIKKEIVRYLCYVMANPTTINNHLFVARKFDTASGDFLEKMRLVQGPGGCATSILIYPADKHNQEVAASLKTLIKILAIDLVGNRF
ncbi:hypothetical protein A9Q84_13025 [Halobacteriovorax marinus]|uniref:Uncharacterized protein n=1 Tax=Halobacteriovorax marinus TaxID=97084 RepID=A0A1Y5FF67_9BACT|nr:hypothetical protein A9Q84_13025 [Halobacteriovorax marinus]